ncbi:MAG: hypothetical protein UV78_C0005G0030 [Parcubacteria group bacterium GW2011_GWA2_43_17]|nr:MAG: hypothetical protein UV78_C0005G0030 [Parcubacteria group bacterium GW2011_GWA2_43_17]KKT92839.1 MAG: hypothetical protein UW91_C0015G0010 [Parcubacteria group bacterium GW2011_GWF2_45_11]KKT98037.1 MAG: hypothetical protein UW98_C0011G0018 [Parcubacteria group bacterium GW2011_GWC2_45_15]OGY94956.1 MAG: hypothetical protein A2260_01055 [Candidatus Komeilibacteria bacterium RIFOXYA2_FULL_45_9]OGY95043.1 MAG: hypothetical protein A3J95_02035 [Candidatus Komeilibacteria bacterium RIFOXYC2
MAKPLIIRGIIDRFENKLAVIVTPDKTEILWPIKNLPEEIGQGSAVRLTLSTNESAEQEREALAKSMLNDILNNAPEETNLS